MGALTRYFGNYWRGKVPFAHALGAMGLTYLGIRLMPLIPEMLDLVWLGVAAAGTVVMVVCIGAARKARQMLRDSAGLPGAALLTLCGIVLAAAGITNAISALLPDTPAIAPYVPPPPKVVRNGTKIVVRGDIDYQMLAELRAVAHQADAPRIILLDSAGGNVNAGRAIGMFIAENKLETLVEGECFSACTLAFAGGAKRRLGTDGVLGFHRYRYDHDLRQVTQSISDVQARDRAFFISRGISEDFLLRAYSVPPNDLWRPDRSELLRSGVLTRPE